MIVLGIETSCDETAIGLYDGDRGLLGHLLHSQVALHARHGGVVPELASRDHVRFVLPLIEQLLAESKVTLADLDAIAYTAGPGLIGALMVGASVAQGLAWALELPALPIHHMEAHLLAPLLQAGAQPDFPFIALLVSGGHTLLVRVAGIGDYLILGQSLDDAVGEAFDKTAKLLGLGYPGGPAIEQFAVLGKDPQRFVLTRPMVNRPGLDFSFSGLKTQVRNLLEAQTPAGGELDEQARADLAMAFENTVAETLAIKCERALQQEKLSRLVIAGGVSANRRLRLRLAEMAESLRATLYFPAPQFCTDNGAMVAFAGWRRLTDGARSSLEFRPRARWSLEELQPPA